MSKKTELTPTSVKEFRRMREVGVTLTLYTGRTIVMSSTDPSYFVQDPDFLKMPTLFTAFILDAFWDGDYRTKVEEFLKPRTTAAETVDFATSLGIVAKKVLRKPVIVDVPQTDDDRDEIALSDLSIEEKVWIFRLAFENQRVLFFLEEHGLDSSNDETEQAVQ